MNCSHCDEELAAGQPSGELHRECLIRMLVGSVGHQQKRCGCYGREDQSEAGLTRRQAAQAAYRYFVLHMPAFHGGSAAIN